jgi:hypothetical protein
MSFLSKKSPRNQTNNNAQANVRVVEGLRGAMVSSVGETTASHCLRSHSVLSLSSRKRHHQFRKDSFSSFLKKNIYNENSLMLYMFRKENFWYAAFFKTRLTQEV